MATFAITLTVTAEVRLGRFLTGSLGVKLGNQDLTRRLLALILTNRTLTNANRNDFP